MMNILFMPIQSAVVELFPYHLDHTLYSTLATLMGVANYPLHGVDGTIIWQNDTVRRMVRGTRVRRRSSFVGVLLPPAQAR